MELKLKEFQPIIVSIIIALSIIFSSMFIMGGIIKYQKMQNQSITVTGSASQNIVSDLAVLEIGFKTQTSSLKAGYKEMKNAENKIREYLSKKGINEKDIKFGQISNYEIYKRNGNYTTNEVEAYRLNSIVSVSSKDIKLISDISKNTDELVNLDIQIDYSNVQYFVSNLDDIKIKMVGEATKNAKQRAESMVNSTGNRIGAINSAKMGVFQIVPVNSTEVSDMGINDTNSIEKKVVAVVNATFTVK